jgi:hypothetical protein
MSHTDSTPTSTYGWIISLYKDVGMTSLLVGFVCYLLIIQMPEMRRDFRSQTDSLTEAVANNSKVLGEVAVTQGNNNRVMIELIGEIRASRIQRQKQKEEGEEP